MKEPTMKIGHFQCDIVPGDLDANMGKLIEGLTFAEAEGLHILTLPESLLTGYFANEALTRENSLTIDSTPIKTVLKHTANHASTVILGFNELRDDDIYNSVLVARGGKMLGVYSKAFPCFEHFTPGRDFPIFEHDGIKFGIVICADGGYIEPCRILALKGAQIIFAPHYNYIGVDGIVSHYQQVRGDHIARVRENEVWFMRCNNVHLGRDEGLERDGSGYGDSYLLNPLGHFWAQSQLNKECFVVADVPLKPEKQVPDRSFKSHQALGQILADAVQSYKEAETAQ
jgi:predicted amidohydrolase